MTDNDNLNSEQTPPPVLSGRNNNAWLVRLGKSSLKGCTARRQRRKKGTNQYGIRIAELIINCMRLNYDKSSTC